MAGPRLDFGAYLVRMPLILEKPMSRFRPPVVKHCKTYSTINEIASYRYLHEDQRQRFCVRIFHLIYYLLNLLLVTAITTHTVFDITSSPAVTQNLFSQIFPFNRLVNCNERTLCKLDCVFSAFPNLSCTTASTESLTFGGNLYKQLYYYEYPDADKKKRPGTEEAWKRCYDIMHSTTGEVQCLNRDRKTVKRTHTCFPGCKAASDVAFTQVFDNGTDIIFTPPNEWFAHPPYGTQATDTRKPCNPSGPPSLLCVEPLDTCEHLTLPNEICLKGTPICFNIPSVLLAAVLGLLLNTIVDFFIVWAMSIDDNKPEAMTRPCAKCTLQMIAIGFVSGTLILLAASLLRIYTVDRNVTRPGVLWTSFVLVLLFEQLMNIAFTVLMWYIMFRRCGRDKPSSKDFNFEVTPSPFLVKAKRRVRKLVNYRGFEIFFAMLLGWMVVDLFINMVLCQLLYDRLATLEKAEAVLYVIDLAVLVLFMVEVALRVFAEGPTTYFRDVINTLDALLILGGVAFRIVDSIIPINKGLAHVFFSFRLIRLYRISHPPTGSLSISRKAVFSSTTDRVIAVLNKALEIDELSAREKTTLKWLIQTTAAGKLYEIEVDEKERKDPYLQAWTAIISDQAQVADQVADEMESILRERLKKKTQGDASEATLPALLQAEYNIDMSLDQAIESYLSNNLLTWTFDVQRYQAIAGRATLPKLFIRCIQHQDVCSIFNIKLEDMLKFVIELEKTSYTDVPFHNAVRSAEVLQAVHFFLVLLEAEIKGYLNSRETLGILLAAVMYDYQHPGVSSAFLIRAHHEIAIRYNDRSVLEHHHVASAFAVMQKLGDDDPLLVFPEDQYIGLRKIVVQLVLAKSAANQSSLLAQLRTKSTTPNFPRSIAEDKKVLLSNMMNAANYSLAARPLQVYLSWSQKYMEELFMQGDKEIELGLPISKNCSRVSTSEGAVQLSLIDDGALPLYNALAQVLPKMQTVILPHLKRNRAFWLEEHQTEEKDKSSKADHAKQSVEAGGRQELRRRPAR